MILERERFILHFTLNIKDQQMTTVGPHVFLCGLKQWCNVSLVALCFHGWMKMLTFGFLFCSFDLKLWNVAIKIIRPKISICTFWSTPNRVRGIFSSTCMSLQISALTSDQKDWTAGHTQRINIYFSLRQKSHNRVSVKCLAHK